MKFCLLCIGSHGDIRPYVALGALLKEKGHAVTIATHLKGKSLCDKYGLSFKQVDGDLTELINPESTLKDLKKSFVALKILKFIKNAVKIQLPMSLEAVRGTDVLIYSPSAAGGGDIAEYLKIPAFLVDLQPEIRTSSHPSYLFPNQKRFLKVGHFLTEQLQWQSIRGSVNEWRKVHLGLNKHPFLGRKLICPTLIAFSPNLIPEPLDWPSHVKMTGFCRLMEGNSWTPPNALEKFLKEHPKSCFIGYGSLTEGCQASIVESMLSVLKNKQIPAVIQANLAGLDKVSLPSTIFPIEYAPHDWLFPRVKAVIHHGGIGTTAAGLYAGRPTLIMPFVWDQFFWGKKIFELGLGPTPLPMTQFNADLFAERLDELLSSKYDSATLKMKASLNQELPGTETTLNYIFEYLNSL